MANEQDNELYVETVGEWVHNLGPRTELVELLIANQPKTLSEKQAMDAAKEKERESLLQNYGDWQYNVTLCDGEGNVVRTFKLDYLSFRTHINDDFQQIYFPVSKSKPTKLATHFFTRPIFYSVGMYAIVYTVEQKYICMTCGEFFKREWIITSKCIFCRIVTSQRDGGFIPLPQENINTESGEETSLCSQGEELSLLGPRVNSSVL